MVRRVRAYLQSLKIIEDESRFSEMSQQCEPSCEYPHIWQFTCEESIHTALWHCNIKCCDTANKNQPYLLGIMKRERKYLLT